MQTQQQQEQAACLHAQVVRGTEAERNDGAE